MIPRLVSASLLVAMTLAGCIHPDVEEAAPQSAAREGIPGADWMSIGRYEGDYVWGAGITTPVYANCDGLTLGTTLEGNAFEIAIPSNASQLSLTVEAEVGPTAQLRLCIFGTSLAQPPTLVGTPPLELTVYEGLGESVVAAVYPGNAPFSASGPVDFEIEARVKVVHQEPAL